MEQNKQTASKRRQKAEKSREKRTEIVRKRLLILVIAVVVAAVLVIALICKLLGVFDAAAEVSTLTLTEDGQVICEEVTSFEDDAYSKGALKSYMKEEIKAYTSENGANSVKLDKVKVKNGEAYAKVTYASAEDYSHFTSLGLYVGTIEEALEQGFDFSDAFVSVTDGVKGASVEPLDITSQKDLKIAVVKENINVTVDGKILYVSDSCTTMVDEDTVAISQPDGNQDATQLTYIIYQ